MEIFNHVGISKQLILSGWSRSVGRGPVDISITLIGLGPLIISLGPLSHYPLSFIIHRMMAGILSFRMRNVDSHSKKKFKLH